MSSSSSEAISKLGDQDQSNGPGRRAGLTKEDAVAATIDLVRDEGPSALSMRRLATELGIGTSALYWHIGNKDELVAAVVHEMARRHADYVIESTEPGERVLSAAMRLWSHAVDNPNITMLAYQEGLSAVLQHPLEVRVVEELEAAGVPGPEVADALGAIIGIVGGFLLLAMRPPDAWPEGSSARELWDLPHLSVHPVTQAALTVEPDLVALITKSIRLVVDDAIAMSTAPRRAQR